MENLKSHGSAGDFCLAKRLPFDGDGMEHSQIQWNFCCRHTKSRECVFQLYEKRKEKPFLPLTNQCANARLSNMDAASATATAFMDEVVFRFTLRCDEDGIRCARRDGAGTA